MSTDKPHSPAEPSVYAALSVQAHADVPLTAAQQRYNALLARIEALSGQIERLQAWSDQHRHAHVQALYQAAQEARAARQNLLIYLHEQLQTDVLTAQQQRMARTQVRLFLDQLMPSADPQVQALAELYQLDDEELAEERAQEAQRLREQIEAALGQPIESPDQYQTPEEMMAAGMRQWQRQQQADEARKAAKRAARKALKKPAAHQQAEVQQADARSALRTVFRQLASALHPDREPDEQLRVRKTALMSEVNAAYEKNDLSTLLRLQMQAALAGQAGASRLADDKLAAMSLLLKEQVTALEDDLAQLESRLSRELCVPVSAQQDLAHMTQTLQRLQADQRHVADSLSADGKRIQNEAELKRWLKEQSRAFKATSA
jgi:hypothetical protein